MKHRSPEIPQGPRRPEKPGYCPIGQQIMIEKGPASKEFATHIQLCIPCSTALGKEKPPTKH